MSKLDRLGWAATRYFDVGPFHFGVRTTSSDFGEWLDYALGAYRVLRPARIRYSVVVASERPSPSGAKGLNILYRGTTPIVRSLEPGGVARALLADIDTLLLPGRDDFVYLRGGLVSAGGVTVLVPASLLLALAGHERRAARMGLAFWLSTAVAADLSSARLYPVPPQIAVPSDAVARVARSDGSGVGGPSPEGVVADTVVTVAAPEEVRSDRVVAPAARAATLYRMAPWLLNLPRLGREAFAVMGRVVSGADCYVVRSSGDVARALGVLASGLEPGRASRERGTGA